MLIGSSLGVGALGIGLGLCGFGITSEFSLRRRGWWRRWWRLLRAPLIPAPYGYGPGVFGHLSCFPRRGHDSVRVHLARTHIPCLREQRDRLVVRFGSELTGPQRLGDLDGIFRL